MKRRTLVVLLSLASLVGCGKDNLAGRYEFSYEDTQRLQPVPAMMNDVGFILDLRPGGEVKVEPFQSDGKWSSDGKQVTLTLQPNAPLLRFFEQRFSNVAKNTIVLSVAKEGVLHLVMGDSQKTMTFAFKRIESLPADEIANARKAILGEWVTVATSAGHYDGVMQLKPDGTWTETDVFRKDGKKEVLKGTFEFRKSGVSEKVVLTVKTLNGKAGSTEGPPLTLTFDRAKGALYQAFPGTLYARRGHEARVLKEFGLQDR